MKPIVKVIFYTKMLDIYDTWTVEKYNKELRKKALEYMRDNEAVELVEIREIKVISELMKYNLEELNTI